jgi:hypothetical protein
MNLTHTSAPGTGLQTRRFRRIDPLLDFDPSEFEGADAGPKKLAVAILQDAIACMLGAVGRPRQRPKYQREARAWVESTESDWIFSFEAICELLKLPTSRLRTALCEESDEILHLLRRAGRLPRVGAAEIKEIRAAVRQGVQFYVIAKQYRVSKEYVSELASSILHAKRATRNRRIHKARRQGLSYHAIAMKFGVSKSHAQRICTEPTQYEEEAA